MSEEKTGGLMTIKALYEKYQNVHVIYVFQWEGDSLHARVLTPGDRTLIEHIVLEVSHA